MKTMYNKNAFSSNQERKYSNWEGSVLSYTFDFVKKIENKIDLENINHILDIGSRDACQALELSDWFPNSKIHCFEPIPETAEWCKKNIKDRNNIIFYEKAIGSIDGQIKFHKVINGNIGASSLYKANDNHYYGKSYVQEEIQIDCIRGDSFLKNNSIEKIDLIWMDVQGAEIEVLKSFNKNLHDIKAIHSEVGLDRVYKNATTKKELINFMEDNDFFVECCLSNDLGIEEDIVFINKKFLIK
jgi:FkbM family methyltransferase